MPRRRKYTFGLPVHVTAWRSPRSGKVYYTFQKHRGTARAGPRRPMKHPDGTRPEPGTYAFMALYNGFLHEPPPKPKANISRMIEAYRNSTRFAGLAESTRRDYERYLTQFEADFGSLEPHEIDPLTIQTVHDGIARDRAVTARHFVAVIKALYAWAIPRGHARSNPCSNIDMVRVHHDGAKPWPQWALDRVAAEARWEVALFVALGLYTGQRSGDIVRMRLSDVDWSERLISVRQQKTGKHLQIPIHRELMPYIEEARARASMVLVPGASGKVQSANAFDKMWRRDLRRIGGDWSGIRLHGLRKSAAVKLREVDCTPEQIGSVTGMSRAMVEHYCRDYDQVRMARAAVMKWEA